MVKKILSSKLHYQKLQYQTQWQNHDPDPTWYNAENFKNFPIRLQEFHQAHPNAPGPPVRLSSWLNAAANNKNADDHPDDNKPLSMKNQSLHYRRNA
jgi:hypothetical protein